MSINLDLINISEWINLTLIIVAIVGWIYFYRRFKEPMALAALSWLFNAFLYFSCRLFLSIFSLNIKNTFGLNFWSGFLHTHTIILLGAGAFIGMDRLIHNNTYMERLAEKVKRESEKTEVKNE